MVSTRPLVRKVPSVDLHWPALPSSAAHGLGTQRALYLVGGLQALSAIVFAVLALTGERDLFVVSTSYIYWIPVFVALIGIAMSVFGHLGSLSAPWLAALVNLPLALTALYIDGLLSMAMVVALLSSAGWLGYQLLEDAARRQPADDF